MKIYTKTGDKGQTSLYDQHRVYKDDIRVEAYGTIDELNSTLGFAKNFILDESIFEHVEWIQRMLFDVAGELATRDATSFPERVTLDDIQKLEEWIDVYIDKMGRDQVFQFILPGSNKASGSLHVARTICRRAERRMITLSKEADVSETVLKFVNRLSDCIYSFARYLEDEITLINFKK
jgi:cob(I)alamin adenosyltransferase